MEQVHRYDEVRMHSRESCSRCGGNGLIPIPWAEGTVKPCEACDGRGWVPVASPMLREAFETLKASAVSGAELEAALADVIKATRAKYSDREWKLLEHRAECLEAAEARCGEVPSLLGTASRQFGCFR